MHMDLDISSITNPTKLNIIKRQYSIVRLTSKLTFLNLRPRKTNLMYILSNVSTVRANIKWIAMYTLSKNTVLTKNSTQRNTKSFVKTRPNQFTQLWVKQVNNY